MCGIAGILTAREDLDLEAISTAMVASLRHRGPDDEGRVELSLPGGRRLALVHTRLSILDLSAAGHQPMTDASSGTWVTYNGELFNHLDLRRTLGDREFHSNCDTETLLSTWAAHGVRAVDLLRGMYAFAMYDAQREELCLVRDRVGIKPLYVFQADASTWLFASEVRALLSSGLVPRRLNPVAIDSYLAFGATAGPWTMIEGVQSVLPGELWRFDLSHPERPLVPRKVRYWRPAFVPNCERLSYREAIARVRPALIEAVSSHMISDVPVGVFLSGGIDSSSIVAALAHAGHQPHTFSVRFGEHDFDESRHAAHVARQFGTTHTELMLSPESIIEHFPSALAAYDRPSIDGVNTFFISQKVAEAGIKVAISGLGGDELFAGYPNFRLAAYADHPLYRMAAKSLYAYLRRSAANSLRTEKLKAILDHHSSRLQCYTVFRQVMLPPRRRDLLEHTYFDTPIALPDDRIDALTAAAERLDAINAFSLFELSLYMVDTLLRDTDQMSMAHPVEVRVPLVDHRLVDALASIPGRLKSGWRSRRSPKRLLVDALPAALPPEVVRRQKMGFVLPWELWLRNELADTISSILDDAETLQAAAIRPAAVQHLWRGFRESRPGVRAADILALVHLVHWVRQHRLSVG
ncbi:MAG TPA: asparagine synthase (glutamine-hydrolyzing) [Pirellulales bacterium]|nr:asparagine synthase (glutamine-hydrolyzing) [Pirellulales bacterium]